MNSDLIQIPPSSGLGANLATEPVAHLKLERTDNLQPKMPQNEVEYLQYPPKTISFQGAATSADQPKFLIPVLEPAAQISPWIICISGHRTWSETTLEVL